MRFAILSVLLTVAAVGVSGLAPQRQVLVTYPKDTPESTIDSAKDAIKTAGGQITAEFSECTPFIGYFSRLLTHIFARPH